MMLQTAFNTVGMKIHAYSPEILTGVAIAANIGGLIFASKAALKLQGHLDDLNEKKAAIKENEGKTFVLKDGSDAVYDSQMVKDDMVIAYRDIIFKIFKDYLPVAALTVGSMALLISSNNIHAERNAGMAAAYSALAGAFAAYRKRVTDAEGSKKDEEYLHGTNNDLIGTEIDESSMAAEYEKISKNQYPYSAYARTFDNDNPNWKDNPFNNLTFLEAQERILNDRLIARGYLFLNEVYDALGFDRSQAGNMVGWVYDPKDPNRENRIDFGMYRINGDTKEFNTYPRMEFLYGMSDSTVLDFNVDGPIYDILRRF